MSAPKGRWAWRLLVVAIALWLVPAGFVALYDPGVPREPLAIKEAIDEGPRFFLLAHGYVESWTVETWEGEEESADKHSASYQVERGLLDRRAGMFELAVSCRVDHAEDLEALRLFVTDAGVDAPADAWRLVDEHRVEKPGAFRVALRCRAKVPASSTAYRLREVRDGEVAGGFSQSMPTAPTLAGRVYDRIAWLPPFKWVPGLR